MGSQSDLFTTFDRIDLVEPDRGEGTPGAPFEIGLVAAGAVSAGSYIAGVYDYLFEALEEWQAAKAADSNAAAQTVPNHAVVLKVLAGASAGSMASALLAATAGKWFPHISWRNMPRDRAPTGNPLFDAWVQLIGVEALLGTQDLSDKDSPIISALDSTALRNIGLEVLDRLGHAPPIQRPYLENPLRLFLTVTNARGVPYWIPFTGSSGAGHGMMCHGDHVRFSVGAPGGATGTPPFPDELDLRLPVTGHGPWVRLIDTALASGAFPLGLAPRGLNADPSTYSHRFTYEPDPQAKPRQFRAISPFAVDWPPQPGSYNFVSVDGGVVNNEPFDLAHRVLAGAHGRNPRTADKATRAIIMVDPFPETPGYGPADVSKVDLFGMLGPLKDLLVNQARFRVQDLALAHDEAVFSRFIIIPKRDGTGHNGKHLASGCLESFGGFLDRELRVHDYLLGRRNCQNFLMNHFTLPEDHALFSMWGRQSFANLYHAQIKNAKGDWQVYVDPDGKRHLPIIPVLRDAKGKPRSGEEELPNWPIGVLKVEALTDLVTKRARALERKLDGRLPWYGQAYTWIGRLWLRSKIKKLVKEELEKLKDTKSWNF